MHGLTVEEAERRWNNELSAAERCCLVTEAGMDLDLNGIMRHVRAMLPSELGDFVRNKQYADAVISLGRRFYTDIYSEVHRRLAGGSRPNGRGSIIRTLSPP
ncbi:TPA: hypothetical protein DCZ32_00515 [Candidatus Uhrbacteria bacterium]|nr:hypothetical protein [Candidatus Uhrbacteria bacterium]